MTAVRQHEVALLFRLRIALGLARELALYRNRLKIIGHRVAINRIVIPRLEAHALADLFAQELRRKRDARIEPPIVTDLHHQPRFAHAPLQFHALLDADTERLLDQHMLARCYTLERERR